MDIQKHVDALFADYQENPALNDFKEELASHLDERIKSFIKKGMDEIQSLEKALDELGDISSIADELGKKKRQEVFFEAYMKNTKTYMDKKHIYGYILAGGLLALGVILTLTAYFASGEPMVSLSSGMLLIILPICAFVFLGLTQETAKNYPMNWKRALIYTATAGLILFGLKFFAATLLKFFIIEGYSTAKLIPAIGSLLPFALPGTVILAFLLLTEKNRHKPWVMEQQAIWAKQVMEQFADPYAATRFGLYSGALWIFALALFIALGFIISFKFSWLVFLLAISVQILILALMTPKNKDISGI